MRAEAREARRAKLCTRSLAREAQRDAELAQARAEQRAQAATLEEALSSAQSLQEELLRTHRDPSTDAEGSSLLSAPGTLAYAGWEHDPRIAAPAPPDAPAPGAQVRGARVAGDEARLAR